MYSSPNEISLLLIQQPQTVFKVTDIAMITGLTDTVSSQENTVYDLVRSVLLKYGKIHDEAKKFYGSILVLDYGVGEHKIKVEISKRDFGDTYHMERLLGFPVKLMDKQNMFAHKLCAMLDRNEITNRDIFDTIKPVR